jgi:hypothetical protein
MPDDRSMSESVPLADWLKELGGFLGPSGGPGLPAPTDEEQAALLDLARVAAHNCERIAAPLTTFMAGVALAEVAPGERAERIRSLAASLEGVDPSP